MTNSLQNSNNESVTSASVSEVSAIETTYVNYDFICPIKTFISNVSMPTELVHGESVDLVCGDGYLGKYQCFFSNKIEFRNR